MSNVHCPAIDGRGEEYMSKLEGKIALITGGTRGIGAASAIALGRMGADVAIVGRHMDEQARETKSGVEALGRRWWKTTISRVKRSPSMAA
jgi:NAD(P)-dependent dehydrogenase (short-subunit alcohol dehydrogenase family)